MLRVIEPKDIGLEWERVREGLVEVKKASSEDWLPEDVYMVLKNGEAALYIGEDEHGDYEGFLVLRLIPMFHGVKLLVWCAYAATKTPLMAKYMPEIQGIAKAAKAKKLGFLSPREEWGVVCRRLGFKPAQVSYELDV